MTQESSLAESESTFFDVEGFVAFFGGRAAVRKATGYNPKQIAKWIERKSIPFHAVISLLLVAEKRSQVVNLLDFVKHQTQQPGDENQ